MTIYIWLWPYDLFSELEQECCNKKQLGNILLAGDLNARTNNQPDFVLDYNDRFSPVSDLDSYVADQPLPRNNMDITPCNSHGEKLLDLCKTLSLRILNGRYSDESGTFTRFPTKIGDSPSAIDYFIADSTLLKDIKDFKIQPFTNISDHCCITSSISSNLSKDTNTDDLNIDLTPLPAQFKPDQISLGLFKKALSLSIEKYTEHKEDVNIALADINEVILSAANQTMKIRTNRPKKLSPRNRNRKKWYDDECRKLKSKLNIAKKGLQTRPFDQNALSNYLTCRKRYKRCLKRAEKQFKNHLLDKLLALENENPKEYWKIVGKMRCWNCEKSDPVDAIKTHRWIKHFETLFGKDSSSHLDECKSVVFNELNFHIKQQEISSAINSLKRNKSPGIDGIVNEFLIAGKEYLLQPLCNLFNLILTSSSYPKLWAMNLLRPIHKKGDVSDTDNYRGIALSSCLSKLYSYVLLERLNKYILKHKLISQHQIGFLKGKQTSDHIFVLKTLIDKIVKKEKSKLFVAFIDFKKAYDTIDRYHLLVKLKDAGIGGLFLNAIKAMYTSVKYCIKLNDGLTSPIESSKGLKQGDVLSPMLFNLFVNDLKDIFDDKNEPVDLYNIKLNHLLYADDLILMSKTKEGLQACLDNLGSYCDKWNLRVNIEKSKTMIFNPGSRNMNDHKFYLKDNELEPVKNFTYLGIDISLNGSFSKAIDNLKDKANKAMFPLIDTIFKFEMTAK